MERLTKDILGSSSILQHFLEMERKPVEAAISSLSLLVPRFRSTLRAGIEQLFNQLMRPKLRTLVSDIYKDVSYVLDDDSYASAEYKDLVRKRFVKTWESLVDGYKVCISRIVLSIHAKAHHTFTQETFTEDNYRLFLGLALDVLLRPWEKSVMGFKYTEVRLLDSPTLSTNDKQLGAIRFDRDLRSIMAYLSTQTAFGDAREKFLRLQQISTLLNLDSVRICSLIQSSPYR